MSRSRLPRLFAAALLLLLSAAPLLANPFVASPSGEAVVTAPGSAPPKFLVDLQFAFRERIAAALNALKDGSNPAALAAFLGGAFLYGLFHAAGPGHRKTVVFSLFLARKAAPWEPLAAGFLSAAVHAAAGIAVVLILGLLSGAVASLASTSEASSYIEGGTFAALALIAAALAVLKAVSLINGGYRRHEHGEVRAKGLYGIVVLTSLVPCPGAIIVLLFALYLNLVAIGVVGAVVMSIGMGIVISAAAYLAYFGREGLFGRLKRREGLVAKASALLELTSYLLVFIFSAYMAGPFAIAFIAHFKG